VGFLLRSKEKGCSAANNPTNKISYKKIKKYHSFSKKKEMFESFF
jgi:hypothetical protein